MTHSPLPDRQPGEAVRQWGRGRFAHQEIPGVKWRCLQSEGVPYFATSGHLSLGRMEGVDGGSGHGVLKWGSKRVEITYSLFSLKLELQILVLETGWTGKNAPVSGRGSGYKAAGWSRSGGVAGSRQWGRGGGLHAFAQIAIWAQLTSHCRRWHVDSAV